MLNTKLTMLHRLNRLNISKLLIFSNKVRSNVFMIRCPDCNLN